MIRYQQAAALNDLRGYVCNTRAQAKRNDGLMQLLFPLVAWLIDAANCGLVLFFKVF